MSESAIFKAVVKLAPEQRGTYLDQTCGADPALRREIESLLRAHDAPDSFLQDSPDRPQATVDVSPIMEGPGTRIGPYKLLQQIGEGGMGIVYMAEQQEPVRRKVAFKIIKPGLDSKQVIARFEAERQALAMMDHQNIAKVLDADTTEGGRPYFVMELVPGIPITKYCDDNHLTPRQRLELFVPVCQAIQHAHQKGIIHRDIKPSNVLVTMYDDKPVPKVIDFGVAKAIEQRLTEKTLFTQFGTMVGTFEYMSPEQAEMNAFGVDTRSDIYSLGVLLYELLTGTTPLERQRLCEAAYGEIVRLIKEEEPPRPSTRLSSSGAALAGISQQRGSAPGQLTQLVRGELDWIVMRCLEKDRTRRYETANALARDVERYLKDEPVEACPPTTGYKLHKFARKNWKLLATSAAFVTLLLVGIFVSTWQAVRATDAEAKANDNANHAQQKEQEANKQRNEVQKKHDEVQALNEKLKKTQAQLQWTLYAAHMNLAQHAWKVGGVERVLELLDQHRPKGGESDLRGFEWHYFDRLCHSDLLTLKHAGGVRGVAYSPDGKRLASASWDKTVKVWDAQSGKELFTLKGADFVSVVFSPDGKRLATGSGRMEKGKINQFSMRPWVGEVKVWDAKTGKELMTLKDSAGGGPVVFSPDGKFLARGVSAAIGGPNGEVKVWDAQTGKEIHTFKQRWGAIHSMAFSPDGKYLASGPTGLSGGGGAGIPVDQLGDVKVWDVKTGKELLNIKSFATSLAFSPDGKRLAIDGGRGDGIKVWDAQTGQELLCIKGDSHTVAFSPDGKRLVGASENYQTVTVWDAQTGQQLHTFRGHTAKVQSVVFSPDGKRLASASSDNTVRVWDAQSGQEALTFKGRHGLVAFSPDGKRVVTEFADKTVRVWDAHTRRELYTLKGHTAPVMNVVFSPDGKLLASTGGSNAGGGGFGQPAALPGEVKVWDALTGKELFTFNDLAPAFRNVAFSPDGKLLASAGSGLWGSPGEVRVWDAQKGKELFALKDLPSGVHSVVFSPDGKRVAAVVKGPRATNMSAVKVWDAQTGKEVLTLKGRSNAVFSPDGKRIASYNGSDVTVLDAQTGQELLALKGHTNWVFNVVFSPDGKRLASASDDKTAKVWDVQTGKDLLTLKGHTGRLGSVAFSPDGKRLATCSWEDNGVRVWDAETGLELLTLKHDHKGVSKVLFSPDGHHLAITSWDGTVLIWDATPVPEKQ